ncbi:ABC transporter ATP-binding protein [Oscillospiraceae bacterium NTUH-002-81]|nr:ABC transporter ATP-binding protein [Oscillospiraceae bacterium NTUH-002-81]
MDNIAIKVENVTKIYKLYDKPSDRLKESLGLTHKKCYVEHYALDQVNIEVRRGETVGIIGTNGSGKSTILKIITGVLNPTSGNIVINGRISALLELGAGFNMEYTGIENIYLNGTMIGFSKEEIDAKLQDILDFADIGDFINQPVKTYSSGMFVRLAFAVAINIEPEILIVDEALSVGDVFFQAKCYRKFEEFKEQGKTILFVSHDLSSISKYCDRVVLLNKGKKLAEGEPKEIVDLYKKILTNADELESAAEASAEEEEEQKVDENIVWKNHFPVNPSVLEYGKKEAEIIDFALMDDRGNYTNNLEKGKEFVVKMKVLFHEEINDPIFAFTIKDLRGTEITGTNTMFEHSWVGPQKKGNIREAWFRQKMSLQGGEYLLSLGCTGFRNAEFNVYHRLYDVCSITVISDKNTVGFYDMESEVIVR